MGLAILMTVFGAASAGITDAREAQSSGTAGAFVGGTVFALLALTVVVFALGRSGRATDQPATAL